jgi:hypothetical protein
VREFRRRPDAQFRPVLRHADQRLGNRLMCAALRPERDTDIFDRCRDGRQPAIACLRVAPQDDADMFPSTAPHPCGAFLLKPVAVGRSWGGRCRRTRWRASYVLCEDRPRPMSPFAAHVADDGISNMINCRPACSPLSAAGSNIGSHHGLVGTIILSERFASGIQRVVELEQSTSLSIQNSPPIRTRRLRRESRSRR